MDKNHNASQIQQSTSRTQIDNEFLLSLLERLKKAEPQFGLNGHLNIWIVKPACIFLLI